MFRQRSCPVAQEFKQIRQTRVSLGGFWVQADRPAVLAQGFFRLACFRKGVSEFPVRLGVLRPEVGRRAVFINCYVELAGAPERIAEKKAGCAVFGILAQQLSKFGSRFFRLSYLEQRACQISSSRRIVPIEPKEQAKLCDRPIPIAPRVEHSTQAGMGLNIVPLAGDELTKLGNGCVFIAHLLESGHKAPARLGVVRVKAKNLAELSGRSWRITLVFERRCERLVRIHVVGLEARHGPKLRNCAVELTLHLKGVAEIAVRRDIVRIQPQRVTSVADGPCPGVACRLVLPDRTALGRSSRIAPASPRDGFLLGEWPSYDKSNDKGEQNESADPYRSL